MVIVTSWGGDDDELFAPATALPPEDIVATVVARQATRNLRHRWRLAFAFPRAVVLCIAAPSCPWMHP
jgi:hypothetical protein